LPSVSPAFRGLALSAAVTLVATAAGVAVANGSQPAAGTVGHVAVVQAVPDAVVEVRIDGKAVGADVATGKVIGPLSLTTGKHVVDFVWSGFALAATVRVAVGSNQDVVLHLPAASDGGPLVSTYQTPVDPIGPGKARVLVAHTATVGAADVRVDGQAVFTDVTNGEFATADVPAGKHVVALLPAGSSTGPLLGPLDVELPERTVTMAYAIGDPDDGMTLVAHAAKLGDDGTLMPTIIGTGSAGLASDIRVTPFG
jgi:hypothetical protein